MKNSIKKIQSLKEKLPEEEKKEIQPEEDEKTEETQAPAEIPVLGWTKEDSDEELKAGRYLCASPLITDGADIYVISTIREVKIIKKEDENLDEDKKELVIVKWNLEIYDGKTWKFKKSVEIKLDVNWKLIIKSDLIKNNYYELKLNWELNFRSNSLHLY